MTQIEFKHILEKVGMLRDAFTKGEIKLLKVEDSKNESVILALKSGSKVTPLVKVLNNSEVDKLVPIEVIPDEGINHF
tara:strand:- start:3546 stop:3779 length:234 start_codon:yes stop_codon:yes gene_type:complete